MMTRRTFIGRTIGVVVALFTGRNLPKTFGPKETVLAWDGHSPMMSAEAWRKNVLSCLPPGESAISGLLKSKGPWKKCEEFEPFPDKYKSMMEKLSGPGPSVETVEEIGDDDE